MCINFCSAVAMLSRAARCVTSHGLVIRALAECDSEAVARFNGNANSSQMKKIINDSNFCGVICENKDKQPVSSYVSNKKKLK